MRPTFPPTPPPIRGTVPPLSKWAPYDRAHPRRPPISAVPTQSEASLRDWANRRFHFQVNADPTVSTSTSTHKLTTKTILNKVTMQQGLAAGSPISVASTSSGTSTKSPGQKASTTTPFNTSMAPLSTKSSSPYLISPAPNKLLAKNATESKSNKPFDKTSLENLLLQTLDKLASQYKNSSATLK